MTVDEKVTVLHEFHEWRQEEGLAGAHWDIAVEAYERQLRTKERDAIKDRISNLVAESGAPTEVNLAVADLLDQLT